MSVEIKFWDEIVIIIWGLFQKSLIVSIALLGVQILVIHLNICNGDITL